MAVVVWATTLLVLGIPITWSHAAPFTATVTIVTGACLAFDRWLWKLPVFKGWLVKQPNLQGSWKVRLVSNWIDPSTGQTIAPIECLMVIRQRFSSLNARLFTRESSSTLLANNFSCEEDGVYELVGTYRNTPRIDLRGKRSEIHHGSLLLQVKDDPAGRLEGHYWTDRGTRGSLQLSRRVDTLFAGYEDATGEFGLPT
jgi:hypothetical protein